MSALPPKADIARCREDVRFVSLADINGRKFASNGLSLPAELDLFPIRSKE
jgi:hypothetical protein